MEETINNPVIVGAGVSGLAAASVLSSRMPTLVIDRLPVIGGLNAGYENDLALELKHECDLRGVQFYLGATALRWSNHRLLVAGPQGIEWITGSHLIYAGGNRPSTQAELRIVGDRLSGVVPCTLAQHFLETGVRLGTRAVILGCGVWAERISRLLQKQRCRVSVLPMDDQTTTVSFADECWPGWLPTEVKGAGRVAEIRVAKGDLQERLLCDLVVFAARMKPLRNIDGAIFEHMTESVTFIQYPGDNATLYERANFARNAASGLF